jgi:hypothetical protein
MHALHASSLLRVAPLLVAAGCSVGLNSLIGPPSTGAGPTPMTSGNSSSGEPGDATSSGGRGMPAFCESPSGDGASLAQLEEEFNDPKERHTFDFFLKLHWSMCKSEPKPGMPAAAMKMRETIMRELGFTEADMKDLRATVAMSYRNGPIGFDESFTTGGNDLAGALAANPLAQQGTISYAYRYHPMYGLWLADALGDRLSEFGRAALVQACLKGKKDLFIAACLDDARHLDRKKLWRELDDPAFKPDIRLSLKFWFVGFTKQIAAEEQALAARAKQDGAYKTVFVDVPGATTKEWAAFYKANPQLVALTRELEFGSLSGSRKATSGCEAKVTPHLAKHLKAIKPDPEPQIRLGSADTPSGWVTNAAAFYCAKATDGAWAGLQYYFGEELLHGMWLRGPRTATVEKLLARAPDLEFDDRSRKLDDDMPRDAYRATSAFGVGPSGRGDHGVVAKVTPKGDQVAIAFADGEMDELTCEKQVKTERWYYDRSKGEFGPVYQCVKFGSRRVKTKNEPTVFAKAMMTGIAPGRFVQFTRDDKLSVPAHVWDSEKRTKLLVAYGIAR